MPTMREILSQESQEYNIKTVKKSMAVLFSETLLFRQSAKVTLSCESNESTYSGKTNYIEYQFFFQEYQFLSLLPHRLS